MRAALALAALLVAGSAAAADPERGRAVWNFRCYFCHGYSGDAKTLAATYMERKPPDFQSADPREFPIERIEAAIRNGVPGTPMAPFTGVIGEREIRDVAAFLRSEFLERRAPNTRYHTREAGWPDHDRYRDAYPFARGEIPLDADPGTLDASQLRGRRMFLESCITCHDRAHVREPGVTWEAVRPR